MYIISKHSNLAICPRMIIPPENTTVLPGETAKFSCIAHSYSGFNYNWELANGSPSLIARRIISQSGVLVPLLGHYARVSSLAISSTGVPDEGWYCCTAYNECGNRRACAWLEVNSKFTI